MTNPASINPLQQSSAPRGQYSIWERQNCHVLNASPALLPKEGAGWGVEWAVAVAVALHNGSAYSKMCHPEETRSSESTDYHIHAAKQ